MKTSVIIPAINEEKGLSKVLASIPGELISQIILVDGGSTDNTVRLAEAAGALVVIEERPGYGRACAVGAANSSGEILVFMDADGADDPHQIIDLVNPVLSNTADLVLGSRLAGSISPGAMPWHQRFGNRFSANLITRLYGVQLTDLSPFRAVKREKLLALDLQDMTYGWPTEMIVKGARKGWKILEIPVDYRPRIGGRSKISGTLRGTILASIHILGIIFRYSIT
jgi:glycosyltransferase involved in cell wall biosynthesis